MDRLCDPVLLSFVGKFHAEFFCGNGPDVFLSVKLGNLPVVTNSDLGQSIILPTLTRCFSMAASIRQVRATVFGRAEQAVCDGAKAREIRKRDHMKKCYESINADNHHSSGLIHRKSSGRNSHCREYFYVGRSWKAGCRCHQYADYPIIQAYVAWMAVIYVLVNLVTDIVYHYLDPRVRLGGDRA